MKRVDRAVWVETIYIAITSIILSAIMQAVFIFVGWDYTVLLGNLLGFVASVLNFFLLGLSIQRATRSGDVKYAKNFMRLSQAGRMLFLVAVGVIGAVLSCFNIWAVLISLFFPRIALILRPFFFTKEQKNAYKQKKAEQKESDVIEEE